MPVTLIVIGVFAGGALGVALSKSLDHLLSKGRLRIEDARRPFREEADPYFNREYARPDELTDSPSTPDPEFRSVVPPAA